MPSFVDTHMFLDVEFESLVREIEDVVHRLNVLLERGEAGSASYDAALETLCRLTMRTVFVFNDVCAAYGDRYETGRIENFVQAIDIAVHLAEQSHRKDFERYLRRHAESVRARCSELLHRASMNRNSASVQARNGA